MEERIESWLGELTRDEKVSLVAGRDMWSAPGVPRLGIPALKVTDGPNGARGGTVPGAGLRAACFPCGSALAATWNPALVQQVGEALGEEARSKGAHVLLAPTVNIHRSPLAGRNFECYSEDPLLTARTAVAFVRGVQSRGVGTSVKHFVCNDSEFERHTISSEVDERTLREIYLPPFEAAVREAGAWTLMGAYNRVNGTYACEHPTLLVDILKKEWGFDGVVVSDWFATQSTAPAANDGLDLEMPGPARRFGEHLLEAVEKGEVPESTLDEMVRRLLRLRLRTGAEGDADAEEQSIDRPEHRALARKAATEAIVLLRNEGGVLPLSTAGLSRLAVIGPNADVAVIQGGGSAQVMPHYAVTPLEGIRDRCGDAVKVTFERGCTNHKVMPVLAGDLRVLFYEGAGFEGEPVRELTSRRAELTWFQAPVPEVTSDLFSVRVHTELVADEAGEHTFSLTAAGRSRLFVDGALVVDNWSPTARGESFFGAGSPEVTGTATLAAGQRCEVTIEYAKVFAQSPLAGLRAGFAPALPVDLMERAEAVAAGADAAVVVVGLTQEWEGEGGDRVDMELPGRQAELIGRVAAANPNTVVVLNAGSALTMPWLERVRGVLQLWYPGQECGHALADVLFGEADPGGRLPTTFPVRAEDSPAYPNYPGENGQVPYEEGVFVGYRGYRARGTTPRFPFGHGLSYTSFEYGALSARTDPVSADDAIEVAVEVTNTGERAGHEVVQLYVHDARASVPRPDHELAAFAKLTLAAGEARRISLTLAAHALQFWDAEQHAWVAEPGEFELRAGRSADDIRARCTVRLKN